MALVDGEPIVSRHVSQQLERKKPKVAEAVWDYVE